MYFENFKSLIYAFNIKNNLTIKTLKDITQNVRPVKRVMENTLYYGDFDVEDYDTPEIIAERLYGNAELHWVLMLVNEKYDYLEDWPLPEEKLYEYTIAKYGDGNENATHMLYGREHWVNTAGRLIDPPAVPAESLATRVTNIEYERSINEEKRRIRIVHPTLIATFVKDLEEAFIV
jgi:hypothetical protein